MKEDTVKLTEDAKIGLQYLSKLYGKPKKEIVSALILRHIQDYCGIDRITTEILKKYLREKQ